MKKLVSILLALAMIFAMSINALAAGTPQKYQLTITGIKGHTYKVFQVFTGDVVKEGDTLVLTNVKYGKNHYPVDGNTGDPVPQAALNDFLNSDDQSDFFKSQISGDPYEQINPDRTKDSETITVDAGYYLIVDVTTETNMPVGQTKSHVILKIAEETTIASKHANIESTKKVDDKNDSYNTEDAVNWQDAADYDFGDDVPFQLTVTLPVTMSAYDDYTLTFHDKQAAGFDDPVITSVYIQCVGGGEITVPKATGDGAGYILHDDCPTPTTCEFGGCSFGIEVRKIEDIYGTAEYTKGDMLIVEYTAELKTNAVVGRAGNENAMYVCHPDGHTVKDYVTVLTYALTINKVDGANQSALPGASFTLYKWDDETGWDAGVEIVNPADAKFVWNGIDGGKYKLSETTVPNGYNDIADIVFVVDSTHKEVWLADGNTAFEDLIAKTEDGTKVVFADADKDGNEDGKLEGTVENHKGAELPETGAAGTMMLIGLGTMFVLVAAVFMITRKKMSIYED